MNEFQLHKTKSAMSILEHADLIMDSGSCSVSFCMDLPEDDQIVPDLLTPTDSSILASHNYGNGGSAVNPATVTSNVEIGFIPTHQVRCILLKTK
jgi:hypothetical protein